MSASLKRWLREPLLHFLLLGVLLFAAYRMLHPEASRPTEVNRIELTADDLRQLEVGWTAQWRRPPTPEEMHRLVEGRVREEILYREALALGLDRGDTIVKRRLAQKMEFLAGDISALSVIQPRTSCGRGMRRTGTASPIRVAGRSGTCTSLPDRRGDQARADAIRALAKLADKAVDSPVVGAVGDPFMFQDHYGDRSPEQIASIFGSEFAAAVDQVRPGSWQGPIESGLGWHLVFVTSATPGRVPSYDEIEAGDQGGMDGGTARASAAACLRGDEVALRSPFAGSCALRLSRLRSDHELGPMIVARARLSMAWAAAGARRCRRHCASTRRSHTKRARRTSS